MHLGWAGALAMLLSTSACTEALYPPRPPQTPGPALADPPTSRVTMHLSLTSAGLSQLIEASVPQRGEVPFTLIGQRKLIWQRTPITLAFDGATGKLGVRATITGEATLPVGSKSFSLTMAAEAQPVLSSDYLASLQAPNVTITSEDRLLRAAEWGGGVLSDIKEQIQKQLAELRIDLRPMLEQSYLKLAQPFSFKVGDATACGRLGLVAIEAGPTVLAGGLEKDLGAVIAPSVTMPCSTEGGMAAGATTVPPLHNVSSIPSGPFTVTLPVAATYAELQKAMKQAFTNGKLFFSTEYPDLYLTNPEVYASGGQVVTKLHLDGFVKKGFKVGLSGDLYMAGHPQVRDNELSIPDLEPTVETKNALLKLKTAIDTEGLRRQVRQATRLDIGARLQAVRAKFEKDLVSRQRIPTPAGNGPEACVRVDLGRVEVSDVFAHDAYLRLYVRATANVAAYLPCPTPTSPTQR
jgi:hypothetical protein